MTEVEEQAAEEGDRDEEMGNHSCPGLADFPEPFLAKAVSPTSA